MDIQFVKDMFRTDGKYAALQFTFDRLDSEMTPKIGIKPNRVMSQMAMCVDVSESEDGLELCILENVKVILDQDPPSDKWSADATKMVMKGISEAVDYVKEEAKKGISPDNDSSMKMTKKMLLGMS